MAKSSEKFDSDQNGSQLIRIHKQVHDNFLQRRTETDMRRTCEDFQVHRDQRSEPGEVDVEGILQFVPGSCNTIESCCIA
jgi:hypothetical protein